MSNLSFEEANKVIHPVESQWHYKYLIPAGFVPVTKEAVGFVRKYQYKHPISGVTVTTNTGYSSDYWSASDGAGGYWSDLKIYTEKLIEASKKSTETVSSDSRAV